MRLTIIPLLILAAPLTASAQVAFPADSEYIPLRCGDAAMTDGFADESGALDERDIVGDNTNAAGLRASDATNLYLRMRLEEDPAPGGAVRPFSWGMEFDLDGDRATYELLVLVEGIAGAAGTVGMFTNMTSTQPDDPRDPADQPPATTYAFASNARSVSAASTSYGTSADFFLDFAVPWADLGALGLDRDTPTTVWAGTSSSANSLNGDFACHNGATGLATLTAAASDPTTGDPAFDPGAGATRLEGGGGCVVGGDAAPWFVLLAGFPFARRRLRGGRSPARQG